MTGFAPLLAAVMPSEAAARWLVGGALAILGAGTIVGLVLRLRVASDAVRRGARLIATNDDATYPTPDGPIPGGGAIVASVAVAAGTTPMVAGKPHQPMASLVRERCGPGFSSETAIMVGDRWSTDGLFAAALGCPFVLVRTGVTPPSTDPGGDPALDVVDLPAVADWLGG